MELIRSVSYPAKALDPYAFKQAEDASLAHRQVEEETIANRKAEERTRVLARRDQSHLLENERRQSTVTRIVIQAPANQTQKPQSLPQLPAGQSSSAFLTQQIAQAPEDSILSTTDSAHKQAETAYKSTLGLTTTILGLEGFRERVV